MNKQDINVPALVQDYNNGSTIQRIAIMHKLPAGLVAHYLRKEGISIKPGPRKKVVPVAKTEAQPVAPPEDSRAALKRALLRFVEENL